MRPKLKLNHISSLHDARYCSAVGVEFLGFSLDPSHDFYLAPKSIAEIMEWLSGPVAVGEFGYQSPSEIEQLVEEAHLNLVSLPIDYPTPTASEITSEILFRSETLSQEIVDRISQLAEAFPAAKFEFPANPEESDLWKQLSPSILERSLLQYASPDPIYDILKKEGVKPLAFSLGDFVEEPDGNLDYESCDDFIEEYHSIAI